MWRGPQLHSGAHQPVFALQSLFLSVHLLTVSWFSQVHATSALYPGVELPRRNHEPHTSPSALPVPSMLAGPGAGEPPSPGASVFIMPPDLVSALSIFPAPRAAPIPSPASTRETLPSFKTQAPPAAVLSQVGFAPPQALPPLAAAPRFPQQYSQALWPLWGTRSALVASEASAASDAASPLASLKLPPPRR